MSKSAFQQSVTGGLFRTLVFLSLPTIIEQILSTLLQYVDTAMVGQLGEQATATVSTTTTVTWLVNSIPGAIGTAMMVLISRAVGACDQAQVRRLSQQALLLAVVAGASLEVVSIALCSYIPIWMGADPEIQAGASQYFFIISLPLVFRSISTVLGYTLRAVRDTKTPMIISALSNGMNVILNLLFIYILDYGVAGAAIASAISYAAAGLLLFLCYRRNRQLCWTWRSFTVDRSLLRECTSLGLPVLGVSLVSCLGYVVFASLVSGMGTTIFAAHSIAVTAETIFYVPGYGLRTAASTLVGNARGEKNIHKLTAVAKLSVALTVAIMILTGALLFLGSGMLMRLFTPSQTVADLGAEMLRLVALSEPFFGLMVVLEGIFYGLGRTRYAFAVEAIGMWCVRILMTFLCVRVWNLDLRAVWYCMIADNICKALLFAIPFVFHGSRSRLLQIE